MYVRPTALSDPVDERIGRLERLASAGALDDLSVEAWPGEVPLSSDYADAGVVDVYRRFVAWADRADASVEPAFGTRTSHSAYTDETRTVLTTPMVCLTLHDDDGLRAVYPHADGETHHSVGEAVDALAADHTAGSPDADRPGLEGTLGRPPAGATTDRSAGGIGDAAARPRDTARAGDAGAMQDSAGRKRPGGASAGGQDPSETPVSAVPCPACGGVLVNVQGLAACSDCSWAENADATTPSS